MFTADIVLKIQKWPEMPSNMNELLNIATVLPPLNTLPLIATK